MTVTIPSFNITFVAIVESDHDNFWYKLIYFNLEFSVPVLFTFTVGTSSSNPRVYLI